MSSPQYRQQLQLPAFSLQERANLCGEFHQNFTLIENFYKIRLKLTDNQLIVTSDSKQYFNQVHRLFDILFRKINEPIPAEDIRSLLFKGKPEPMIYTIKLSRKLITAKNNKQITYLQGIDSHDISFAVGPAGTGKTYLAVAKAVESFEKGEVQRLIFVRPAVEAGEKLGFLPGDLVEKVLPYLRPVYDALYEMIGFKETQKLIQSDVIEILPLAFMRGRTLNEAFIILDEAQNTTISQMKMFLTRIGFGSKTVVTGDMTQIDLPKGTDSGLIHASKLFQSLPEIGIYHFTSKEVVRHPLVSRIIDCYDNDVDNKS